MIFKGKYFVRSKIVINGNIIKQVNIFKYLENEISFQEEVHVSSKMAKFLRVTALIDRTLSSNKLQADLNPVGEQSRK